MSGYKNFAIVGAGIFGSFVVRQFLKDKAAGTVNEVIVLTRQGSKTTIEGDAKVVAVDYSNKESIKNALTGVDVVICTISLTALNLQAGIAAGAKEAGVKLFVPSEFGNVSEGESEGMFGEKAGIQNQLKAVDIPCTVFYTGPFADYLWAPFLDLDILSGKVTIAGDGNKQVSFTSRADIARYVSFVLTHMPVERLKNRSFTIAGDNKSFNEIFKAYEAKTGKKVQVTCVPVSVYDARIAADANDLPALLQKYFATAGPFPKTDNDLYPGWNPSPVLDNVPVTRICGDKSVLKMFKVLYDHCCEKHYHGKTKHSDIDLNLYDSTVLDDDSLHHSTLGVCISLPYPLNAIIKDSVPLQYIISLAACGMLNGTPATIDSCQLLP